MKKTFWLRSILLTAVVSASLFSLQSCSALTEPDEQNIKLVWADEFNGEAGVLPDTTKWNFDIGTDWGNGQLEYDTRRPENVSLDGKGNLVITAKQESYSGRNYTSARINTKGKYSVTYGKIEARMKLPWGQGLWPAFWMLGADIDSNSWPACGEIDIMEMRGQQPSRIYGSVHGPGYSGSGAKTGPFDLTNDRFDAGFHTFAIEWDKFTIRYYVDGVLYQTIKPENLTGNWVFNKPFFLLLNLAVGGAYVGAPTAATVFPQTMTVDYVRVYSLQ